MKPPKISHLFRLAIWALPFCFLLPQHAYSQTNDALLTAQDRAEIIQILRKSIKKHYVLEKKAKEVEALLQESLAKGVYDEFLVPDSLAKRLTQDLRRWSRDLHFLVFHVPPLKPGELPDLPITGGAGLEDPVILEGNVALVKNIKGISYPESEITRLMDSLNGREAVILDLRSCSGGSRRALQFWLSYFFDQQFQYCTEYERGKKPRPARTLRTVPGNRLTDTPVYILTSRETASGCEALAYHLKHQKRAILVGEQTIGAAHAVKTYDLAHSFRAFIPRSRSEDAVTGTNWEAVGVSPDLATTAGEALEKAEEEARKRMKN